MAKKKDPSITFLNRFGYNVVKVPRVGIEPLDVIGKDETTQWLGPLRSVWKSSVEEPKPDAPRPAVQISGQKTDQLDVKFGLQILANALSAFGAKTPALDFAYQRARSVSFSYTNVSSVSVSPFEAGKFLAKGGLSTENPVVKHYFQNQDAQAYLIVEVIKSNSITVKATDEHGNSVSVDVPAIQAAVGANVTLKAEATSNSTLTYSGTQPVTFGFVVNEIEFDGTNWSIQGTSPGGPLSFDTGSGSGAAATTAAEGPQPVMLSTGCLLRL